MPISKNLKETVLSCVGCIVNAPSRLVMGEEEVNGEPLACVAGQSCVVTITSRI